MSNTNIYIVVGIVVLGMVVAALVRARYRQDIQVANQRVDALSSHKQETECGPIEYLDIGDGYPVLVIHGIFGGLDQGLANMEGMLSDDYRRIVVSRFGYLGSPLPDDATPELQSTHYACLLDNLGIEQVVVVAFSAGSTSALQFALNYPERVQALVLVSANAPGEVDVTGLPQPVAQLIYNSDFAFWLLATYFRQAMYGMMGVPEGYELTAEHEAHIANIMATVLPVSRRAEGAVFDMYVSNPDVQNYPLEDIAVPTLVVNAVDDSLALYQNANQMAQRIPDAEMFAIEQGGHMMLDNDGQVEVAILEFIDRHVSTIPTQSSTPTAPPLSEPTTRSKK